MEQSEPLEVWDDDDGLSDEFISKVKRDAPEGCILCQLDELEDE